MRAFVVFVACGALATMAACGQKSGTGKTAEAPKAAAGAPAPTASAPAFAPWPKRKPGLWVQTMNLETPGFSQSFRFCVDASSDRRMGLNSQTSDTRCEQKSMTRNADGSWTIVSACDMGAGGKSDSTVHVSGDFESRYLMDITSTTTGAPQPAMNGEHKMSMTAEWSGACPAGWSGGDVEMPGGRRINLLTRTVSAE